MTDQAVVPFYVRQTLHEISFNIGYQWRALASGARDHIMDAIGGSSGLAEQAVLWANEFDKLFEAKVAADPDCASYMEDIDDFFGEKWDAFIAGHVADRITEGGKK